MEEAGLTQQVTFYEEPSQLCLPRLVRDGLTIEFAASTATTSSTTS